MDPSFILTPLYVLATALLLQGCMEWEHGLDSSFRFTPQQGRTLFIGNEGNYQYGNASLSCYDLPLKTVENDVFIRANGQKIGDVLQSLTLHDGTLWATVNNSQVLFAIDPVTFREKGRITGLTSPRHLHFIHDSKAYVTQLWDSRIFILDPSRYEVTGCIETGMDRHDASTESMVAIGDHVFVSCWSYQKEVLKIDTRTDRIVDRLEVGIQPSDLVADSEGKLWVLTDGGYEGNPLGHEAPQLVRIDPETMTVEKTFTFPADRQPSELVTTPDRDSLLFICGDIWKMSTADDRLPDTPLIRQGRANYYSMTVCPWNSGIYAADAIDWQQNGSVHAFSGDGTLIDKFKAGIIPGSFCWF